MLDSASKPLHMPLIFVDRLSLVFTYRKLVLSLKEENRGFKLLKAFKRLYLRDWGVDKICIWFQEDREIGSTLEETQWC